MKTVSSPSGQHRSWRIPRRYRAIVFAAVMSVFTVALVSATLTLRHYGVHAGFFQQWLGAFLTAWPIVFVAILVVAPIVNRLVDRLVAAD